MNELSKSDKGLLATLNDKEVGDLIKPLSKEIHLFDTFIAGTMNLKNKTILANLKVGDKLNLQREDNKFASDTINILNKDGQLLGYIPEYDSLIFARLMDAGKLLIAKVKNIEEKGSFTSISISIHLVDY